MPTTAAAKKTRAPALDVEALPRPILHALARHALVVVATGPTAIGASTIENDKRSQAKVIRDLCDAGWLTDPVKSEYGVACHLTPEAILALASEPTSETPLSPWHEERGERLVLPCSPVMAIASGYGTYEKSSTAGLRAMTWRVLHPERYRWALVPSERSRYNGYGRFPIPLDSGAPIAPQVAAMRDAWRAFTASAYIDGLDLVVSDDDVVLRHRQSRARALWQEHRGRTLLALARFGGYSKAEAKEEADEDDVDEIPSLGGGFIHARTPDRYDPARSWEDEAQRQLTEATDAIARAQARHAALLKRYTKVAVANPGTRPYDAMRARFEGWLAAEIVSETGVDPRTLPETER